MICAWCDDFDPADPKNRDASHGICGPCMEKFMQRKPKVDVELEMRETDAGPLPQTTVKVSGCRDLVFLGRPGPLLAGAVEQVGRDLASSLGVKWAGPVDVRD